MGRKRNETNEQYMDRLRAMRGLPPMRQDPQIMDRTRAAVGYINTSRLGRDDPAALAAFMSIFHPEYSEEKVREMVHDKRADNLARGL